MIIVVEVIIVDFKLIIVALEFFSVILVDGLL
jgi:hypothetical protein